MSRIDRSEFDALLGDAQRRSLRYLSGLDGRPVAPTAAALAGLDRFDEELPDGPGNGASTLALLDDAGSAATVASAGGRYFGFVTGGTLPVALAASWLASSWDQNTALPVMSPVAARLHSVVTGWLVDLFGLPATTAAVFTSGATMANATALAAARDHQLAAAGWDAPADGLAGAPPLTVVVGAMVHSTVLKALAMLGLGRNRIVTVPCDDRGRMEPARLPTPPAGPVIVCAQAGDVNTGAFDPLPAVVDWAAGCGAWVHVDGAFGLWAAAVPELAGMTAGLGDAHSWATDGHKWLNVGYDSGIALVRDPAALRRSFSTVAGYLPGGDGFEAMHHSPFSSQRAREVEVWAVLRTLGRAGLADLIGRCCGYARRIADDLRDSGLEVLNDVVLNQVLVRAATDAATAALVSAVQAGGVCWCGPTVWQGRPAMRVSVSAWATDESDVDASLRAIRAAARSVSA